MRQYWDWFANLLDRERHRPLVILGDLNVDVSNTRVRYQREYVDRFKIDWQIPDPMPPDRGSYISKKGRWSRIDHAFVSKSIDVLTTSYVERQGDFVFASQQGHLSDHAVLKLDVACRFTSNSATVA